MKMTHLSMPDNNLGDLLLAEHIVGYHDDAFAVTSNEHFFVLKLLRLQDQCLLFYIHIPYAYPMPDQMKEKIKNALETQLKDNVYNIHFVNAGTESEKKDIQFRVNMGG